MTRAILLSLIQLLLSVLFLLVILPHFVISGEYWLLDLSVSFQPIYALSAFSLILTLLFLSKKLALFFLFLFLIGISSNFYTYLPKVPSIPPANYTNAIKVLQANIAYDNRNPKALFKLLGEQNNDITILFEVNDTYREEFGALAKGKFNLGYAEIEGLPAGIGIISKYPIVERKIHYFKGKSALIVELELLIEGKLIHFYALHPPSPRSQASWRVRNQILEELSSLISRHPKQTTWITADLNTTVWSQHFPKFSHVNSCLSLTGLYGSWPNKKATSWLKPWSLIAIDHCFVSNDLLILQLDTVNIPDSDHFGLKYNIMIKK